nr:transglycosylase domain-containing protein [Aurantiacibacter suaedae]
MWPFSSSRKSASAERWGERMPRDLALEDAPWTPYADLDDDDDLAFRPRGPRQPSYLPPTPPRRTTLRGRIWERIAARGWLWWFGRISAAVALVFILLVAWLAITAPLSKSLQPIAAPQVTLLAADGTPIARKGAVVGEPVVVADLPPHVVEAFLAIEDRRFYSHWGVDPRGIARAAFTGTGGGSTITQQLAKFTFLSPERTLTRKAREALIAFWLEAWLTKDEILERYLSNAYFGDNMYGLRAASLHYFYRKPENLKPEQAAMLAGLLQAPSRLAPTRNPDLAAARFQLVKNAMVAAGYITQGEADAMQVPRLDVREREEIPTGTYFADWALPQAEAGGAEAYASRTITTTLDSRLQNIARRVTERAPLGSAQVALVAMRPNGEVVAMIGGKDYAQSPFNRATQARRQPGSTFKLFVYLAALRNGWHPGDTIDNTEFTTGSYRPGNAGGRYSPTITLADAFAQSSNVAAVRLAQAVGIDKVIETARDLGVTSDLPAGDPSLALGTSTMTLLELTSAYAGVAGNAFPVAAHAFPAEEEGWFDWLWNGKSSLGFGDHEEMETLLRGAINSGTGRAAILSGPNFGKTGTTQNNRDALFVGYAGEGDDRLVVGVWIGNDDNSPLNGVHGGGLPARIWRDFMTSAIAGQSVPTRETPRPDPSGPVQPLDVPTDGEFPMGDGTRVIIRDGEAVIVSDVDGTPVGARIGDGTFSVDIDEEAASRRVADMAREAAAARLEQARQEAERAIEAARGQAQESEAGP